MFFNGYYSAASSFFKLSFPSDFRILYAAKMPSTNAAKTSQVMLSAKNFFILFDFNIVYLIGAAKVENTATAVSYICPQLLRFANIYSQLPGFTLIFINPLTNKGTLADASAYKKHLPFMVMNASRLANMGNNLFHLRNGVVVTLLWPDVPESIAP